MHDVLKCRPSFVASTPPTPQKKKVRTRKTQYIMSAAASERVDCNYMLTSELIDDARNSDFHECQAITGLCEKAHGNHLKRCVKSSSTPLCKQGTGDTSPTCSYTLPPTSSTENFRLAQWADRTYASRTLPDTLL